MLMETAALNKILLESRVFDSQRLSRFGTPYEYVPENADKASLIGQVRHEVELPTHNSFHNQLLRRKARLNVAARAADGTRLFLAECVFPKRRESVEAARDPRCRFSNHVVAAKLLRQTAQRNKLIP